MKRTELPVRFQRLLERIPYVTIATVGSDLPWNTQMVGHFDENMNLYFITTRASRHGKNIAANPHIFVVVYDSSAPLGEGEGLYLQMNAQALNDPRDIDEAKKAADINFTEGISAHEELVRDCPRRLYKAKPHRIWYNSDKAISGHTIDTRLVLQPAKH